MKDAKVIGIDFDDVLFPTNDVMAVWHNRVYGTEYKKEDIISWDHLIELWQCSQDEKHRRIHDFYLSNEHSEMISFYGAMEALNILSQRGYSLVMVTGRPEQFRKQTITLIEKHFPLLLEHMHFTSIVKNGEISSRPKSEFCKELGVELFIDDYLGYASDVASVGIPVLLFDSPWNQTDELPKNVERVFSWDEIVRKLV